MTFEDRVSALASLGFSPRQTRFLVTVALHGGFCLRRQFAAFAGVQQGAPVRGFLEKLVHRQLARRVTYRRDRGYLYHLHAKGIYRALGEGDNRNRRLAGPALIARKLMLLDFVISEPGVQWLATEIEKVTTFTERYLLARADLPQRTYPAGNPTKPSTTRYFVEKLPIYLAGEPPVPHFVYLEHGLAQSGCAQFLSDYATLLRRLPAWTLVVLTPKDMPAPTACTRAFEAFRDGASVTETPALDRGQLAWYFEARRAVEQRQFDRLSVAEVARFRELHRLNAGSSTDALFKDWMATGDRSLSELPFHVLPQRVNLEVRYLSHQYSQFGDLPGVC
ncbi:MAG: hypothetical protein H0W53_18880 [Acidobacteria bacterium]|nr:hypothetical protein [Acidobacteriota bacterium]